LFVLGLSFCCGGMGKADEEGVVGGVVVRVRKWWWGVNDWEVPGPGEW